MDLLDRMIGEQQAVIQRKNKKSKGVKVDKYNPYHDARGRFASGPGGGSTAGKFSKEEQIGAIKSWSDGAYGNIRRAQTGKSDDPTAKKQADAIEEYISQSGGVSGYLARGIATEKPMDFKAGQIIDMKGVSSWSKSDEVADEFTQNEANAYLFVADGVKRAADISMHAMNPGEQEVLVSSKAKFKITDVQYDPDFDQTIVSVTEVEG